MKQVVINQGNASVINVSKPIVQDNCILVRVINSCISVGTELSGLKSSGIPLWRKALESPIKVKMAVEMATTKGVEQTLEFVKGKVSEAIPTGYSNAGIVEAIGKNIKDVKVGERVACAGAQYAYHAEFIIVPQNLFVKIPDAVSYVEASTATIGAIAMQAVRRANPTIGETFIVIGLGIIGQLTTQILKANGCKVFGTDISNERLEQALALGLDIGIKSDSECLKKIYQKTRRIGADGVIVTAASSSHEIISNAFQMCRKKGRVVLVGDVGLNIKREDIYQKELDFYISTSYGPGRYDYNYEQKGQDYPISYVRWTENRNMEAYLQLIGDNKIDIKSMITQIYALDDAEKAYNDLKVSDEKRCIVLFKYSEGEKDNTHTITIKNNKKKIKGHINVAVIGAGNFAKNMHLPNLKDLDKYFHLRAIMTRDSVNGLNTAKRFQADYVTSDYQEILNDQTIDLVIITTPHNLHKEMTLDALQHGKNVFVEKPLCLNKEELEEIKEYYRDESNEKPILMTGFNRRFAKHIHVIKRELEKCTEPIMINYKMNAGYIPMDNWVHTNIGGGRNIGEACHIYDLFTFLANSKVISVQAKGIGGSSYYSSKDNFETLIKFQNGSIANLIYTAMGNKDAPKEVMEIYFDGKIILLNDYKEIKGYGLKINGMKMKGSSKGQKEELIELSKCLLGKRNWPISLEEQIQAMLIAFEVEEQIQE